MTKRRNRLPQLGGDLFLTDGGMETTFIFLEGLVLPHFAAFVLLKDEPGQAALRRYYERYIDIAHSAGTGFILESPTWRANAEWGAKVGYSTSALTEINAGAIAFMQRLREAHETDRMPMVLSGCIGPRGDGYDPGELMRVDDAERYHSEQIQVLRAAGADMVAAMTITNIPEAIGITRAAQAAAIPVAISFTVETDGRLPTGESLKAAIESVDTATGDGSAYFMVNCAHPTHFAQALTEQGAWRERIRGFRANASRRSHAELNEAPDLDAGDPLELAKACRDLVRTYPHINVLGGCCGTDHRHVQSISTACRQLGRSATGT